MKEELRKEKIRNENTVIDLSHLVNYDDNGEPELSTYEDEGSNGK